MTFPRNKKNSGGNLILYKCLHVFISNYLSILGFYRIFTLDLQLLWVKIIRITRNEVKILITVYRLEKYYYTYLVPTKIGSSDICMFIRIIIIIVYRLFGKLFFNYKLQYLYGRSFHVNEYS